MDNTKKAVTRAFRLLFRPIAQILLHAGVTWREAAEHGKATFVDVATREFGIRGRPTNVSRVAMLTGFTRREVRRLRDLLEAEGEASFEKMNTASRLLTAWWQDPDYLDGDGSPRTLPKEGPAPSFEALCKLYVGDVPPSTVLKELVHVGSVAETGEGEVEALSRIYMPVLMDPAQMLRSGSVLQDLGETVAYNLHRDTSQPTRFERRAINPNISPEHIDAFRAFIEQEGQAFLERVDDWLTQHETTSEQREEPDSRDTVRLGLGAYWIEESSNKRNGL